ncbi:hypothetical protein [Vibrio anguillarum]|uniref:Uncharacterized protein n=8 Tax=Vibrio anguillarum TaxID=55601 RepID=A0A1Y0NUW1_VIBAN|nr:hypothetical protein [Vibrio anguillarum]AOT26286.1 hypothetical protein Her_0026 [Vibrio phage Her]AOT26377.1 hypothetical protein CLA_0026 [Vibrio phage Cla]AOT26559.1 hypothetical protein Pel_0026 [Vibrio phage Pel]AOT26650.1 hypothetical protein pVa2_0025 [Vibrio phage pVa-2]AOT26741.1 hypothetical protein pVa1_0026 [Vibrio phage pVa-1]AOT26832.1 hypothetical protein pVa5_0026 [Vibrio phage vB_VspP_pVa5_12Jun]AOT26923.1 hypothetical protein pVa6_0026 [Vibrio phage pVa-6]AOT27018.1 hy
MNQLFNAQGEQVPARPDWDSHKEAIVEMAMDTLFAEKYCDFEGSDIESLKSNLLDSYYSNIDEYDLAKKFESDGWDVNRDFIAALENVCGHLAMAERTLVSSWFDDNKPVAPFNVGDELIVNGEVGVISEIFKHSPAYFGVKMPGMDENTCRLVKFEDAVPHLKVLSINKE